MTLPRLALICPRKVLPSRRRCLDAFVGLVALRMRGGVATLSTNSCSRCKASARFISWLRLVCALMTSTPSRVMRWSFDASSRAFTSSGSDDAGMSKQAGAKQKVVKSKKKAKMQHSQRQKGSKAMARGSRSSTTGSGGQSDPETSARPGGGGAGGLVKPDDSGERRTGESPTRR